MDELIKELEEWDRIEPLFDVAHKLSEVDTVEKFEKLAVGDMLVFDVMRGLDDEDEDDTDHAVVLIKDIKDGPLVRDKNPWSYVSKVCTIAPLINFYNHACSHRVGRDDPYCDFRFNGSRVEWIFGYDSIIVGPVYVYKAVPSDLYKPTDKWKESIMRGLELEETLLKKAMEDVKQRMTRLERNFRTSS